MSAMRLRVLAVDHTGGVGPFRRKFAALAAEPGIDLTVLAPRLWVENFRRVRLDPGAAEQAPGYKLRAGSVVWPGYENRGFFVTGLAGALAAARPQILHLWEEPFSVFALQALWLRRLLAPRSQALFFSSDNLTRDGRYPYRPSRFYRQVERYAFRSCACGTAVSREVEEVLRIKGFRGHIEVVPHGIDLEDFPERREYGEEASLDGEPFPRPVVGYVGRLLQMKGVETLLRAFAALPWMRDGEGPTLLIVGDGPDRDAFVRTAAALGLGNRVRFVPGASHDRMPEVYRTIDVLVVPSRTTPGWKEQFGRVLIEGMASGCVVIGSSSGAIPHVLGDAGLVFPEDDVPALTAAIRRALEEPALSDTLRSKGRERVRREFTWRAVAAKLAGVYREMMARAEAP
ncbi:MAG: glycosyltransferase family 4 protein [Candidatus Eiseniibacteriota bacterium]